jgi:hypothetical protein
MKVIKYKNGEWIRCDSKEEIVTFVIDGNWKDTKDFEDDVGFECTLLIGKWFTIIKDEFFLADDLISNEIESSV